MDKAGKIAFFLLNQKGYEALKNYLEHFSADTIDIVVIGTDKNIENDYSNEILDICKSNEIKHSFRNEEYRLNALYSFAIGWRWIINIGTKLIVLHDSLLPKYRGFAPLVNCLVNNEKEIGVTALYASEEYDRGDIIGQEKIEIEYPIKIQSAIDQIAPLYSKLVNKISHQILMGKTIEAIKQSEKLATYSLWRDEDDYLINWNDDATKINRFVDAVGYPYRGAKIRYGHKYMRVWDAEAIDDVSIENRQPGKVIFVNNGCPVVVCGKGLLKLSHVTDDSEDKKAVLPLKNFRVRFQ